MVNSPDNRLPLCLQVELTPTAAEPLDVSDLAARLEADGVTDSVAASEFGFDNTRHMAETWLPRVVTYGPALEAEERSPSWLREYLRGIAFAVPLLFSYLSTAWFGFALWGGQLPDSDAAAVGLGVVASFLLTGGVVQAMVRRGLFFITTQQMAIAKAAIWQWIAIGAQLLAAAAVLLVAASQYWQWLPLRVTALAAMFCISLGLLWLGAGALYVLNKGVELIMLNIAGVGVVWLLHEALHMSLLLSQAIAIGVCAGSCVLLVWASLRNVHGHAAFPDGVTAYDVFRLLPYLLYGGVYYLLLFTDRLLAWTAHTYADSLAVQFRGDYESAANAGLILFVFLAGWIHCSTGAFYSFIASSQRLHGLDTRPEFGNDAAAFYWRNVRLLFVLAILLGGLTLWIAQAFSLLPGPSSFRVACLALPAFGLLILGLWNVNLLFGLSAAWLAVSAGVAGCAANLMTGYLASRMAGYEYAALGLLAGSLTFAILSTRSVGRALRNLDYRCLAATG